MNRQDFEGALYYIEILLSYEIYGEPLDENEYQKWFEEHKILFELLGYKDFIPHPIIEAQHDTKKVKIPDFIVQGFDDVWSIFEIKRPDTKVLKSKTERQNFYSSFNDYIAQCFEYIELLDDYATREAFNSKYNVNFFKSPRCTLVAGRNEGLDRSAIQNIMNSRTRAVIDFKTYDDIINTVEHHREKGFGQYDDVAGFTAGGILLVSKLERRNNFIVDIGMNHRRNRISIFVNKHDRLYLRVLDNNGKEYTTYMKMGNSGFSYDELFAMYFEVGITDSSTIISLEINCEHSKDIYVDNIKFDSKFIFSSDKENPYLNILWGTDILFKARANFEFGDFFIYKNKVNYKSRNEIRTYLYRRMHEEVKTTVFGIRSEQFGTTSTNLISPRRQKNTESAKLINLPYSIDSLPPALFEYFHPMTGKHRKFNLAIAK